MPAVVDLAAMRDAMADLGGDPARINPLVPADLVIDHSVQVDRWATGDAFPFNVEREYERNGERYQLLRWAQTAFRDLRVVPPGTGIVHQVNLEYLATVVARRTAADGTVLAFPDTLVGTDSHTTMINGLGVLGYGVGGIEAEAVLLGQPLYQPMPRVVGVRLSGELPIGSTATDLVLVVTERLRAHGVVGAFVEFAGDGLAGLTLADRATISNMSPEFGATATLFPVDEETLTYLRLTGRPADLVDLVERYTKTQGLWREPGSGPLFDATLELDLATVRPAVAGPRRPQDRVDLADLRTSFRGAFPDGLEETPDTRAAEARFTDEGGAADTRDLPPDQAAAAADLQAGSAKAAVALDPRRYRQVPVEVGGQHLTLGNGSVVIAAITSCTNTSNPTVMVGAGLLARNAVARGLAVAPTVKTSLAPGSRAVTGYLEKAGLMAPLETLGFDLVGYGCTTCIGNSGPLDEAVARAVEADDLVVVAVLSGNRNFEGRIHPLARASYLASPPLVVAFALAGRVDIDLTREPLGTDGDGRPVFLADIWPRPAEIRAVIGEAISPELFNDIYASVFDGDERWRALPIPDGDRYAWDPASTYIARPPFFAGLEREPAARGDLSGARVLALLGDSVTTDHISPAGSIPPWSPAGTWLQAHGVPPLEFNSYGARRGHHEVMMRGTFGNIRLRNAPGRRQGGPVHDAPAERRRDVPVRRRDALPGRGRAAAGHRRPRVRLRLVARLGRQGHRAARRAGGAGPELRADPSLQPRRHGRPAAGVPARRERRVARADRPRALRRAGPGRWPATAPAGDRPGHRGRTGSAAASPRWRAWTDPSTWSTTARAASCRPSCAASPPRRDAASRRPAVGVAQRLAAGERPALAVRAAGDAPLHARRGPGRRACRRGTPPRRRDQRVADPPWREPHLAGGGAGRHRPLRRRPCSRSREAGLRAEISVKPTQLGLDLDDAATLANARRLAASQAEARGMLWLDMEDHTYVDRTLALVRTLRDEGAVVGVCLQAYLRRTAADLEALAGSGIGVRLVKGAYAEPADVAFPAKRDVDLNFMALAARMLELSRGRDGLRTAFATHDIGLLERIAALAERSGITRASFEIGMLYGIRAADLRRLAQAGHEVRCLIAYGTAWYPWYMRRLAERPANVLFVLRQLGPGR